MKKKLLLIGYRAYGDWIYASAVLPILTEQYDVYLEMNIKGFQLFHDDPRFKQTATFVYEDKDPKEFASLCNERWAEIREQIKPDVEINLNGTLEASCIARREQPEFFRPVGERRLIYGNNGFYDVIFKRCGLEVPNPLNLQPGLYFPQEVRDWAVDWRRKLIDQYVIIMPIHGSSIHKQFRNWRKVVDEILIAFDDALIYLTGDQLNGNEFDHPRVRYILPNAVPIKQTILMTRYVGHAESHALFGIECLAVHAVPAERFFDPITGLLFTLSFVRL